MIKKKIRSKNKLCSKLPNKCQMVLPARQYLIPSPNTDCFSRRWPLLGARKSAPKKLKNNSFQDKFYPLKARGHYFTVLIYVATWWAAKLGIFTHSAFANLPRCSQTINSLIYVYSIQTPDAFSWMLDHSCDGTSSYYCRPKKSSALTPESSIMYYNPVTLISDATEPE